MGCLPTRFPPSRTLRRQQGEPSCPATIDGSACAVAVSMWVGQLRCRLCAVTVAAAAAAAAAADMCWVAMRGAGKAGRGSC